MTTPTIIEFFVSGEPKPQPRPRAFARKLANGKAIARVYEAGTAENWKSQIAIAAKPHVPLIPLEGPLRVDITFQLPRPKMHFRANGELKADAPVWHTGHLDRDNLTKAADDCLTTIGMWQDDGQVCAGEIVKRYANSIAEVGAVIRITRL